MDSRRLRIRAVLAAALAALACGPSRPKAPGREVVTPLLRQEAEAMKREGEKMDPALRVKATWNIEGVDVVERPKDPDRPWAGTIRFKIRGETKDYDGSVTVDEFERRFDYVYSASLNRWIFQAPPGNP
jgi:hypothetical protein